MKPLLLNLKWKAQKWPASWSVPSYQAHRGYWQEGVLQNSLEAFHRAHLKGYEMFELDTRLSKDHIPVVFHDANLSSVGQPLVQVRDLTARELFEKTGAPTLADVLKMKTRPEKINIELKADNGLESLLEKKVVELVTGQSYGPVMFSSFNPYSIWFLAQLAPQIPRALLATQELEPGNHFYLRHLLLAPLIQVNMLNLDHRYVDAGILHHFHQRNIPLSLWTVNDPEAAFSFLEAGVSSIITDCVLG